MPGVRLSRPDVHQLGIRINVIPKFVTAIYQRDRRSWGQGGRVSGQTQKILFSRGSKSHQPKSSSHGQFIQVERAHIPFVGIDARADPQALVRGSELGVEKNVDSRCPA